MKAGLEVLCESGFLEMCVLQLKIETLFTCLAKYSNSSQNPVARENIL